MKGVDGVDVVPDRNLKPAGHELLQDRVDEKVVWQSQPCILAAHGGVQMKSAVADQKTMADGAGDVSRRDPIPGWIEDLDHRLAALGIAPEQVPDLRKLVT